MMDKMQEELMLWSFKKHKALNKKLKGKGLAQYVLKKRTLNTACAVVQKISNISFLELTLSLYVLCKDTQANKLARKYESMLELAKANKETFADNLYQFFNDTARYIKENNLQDYFLSFVAFFNEKRTQEIEEPKKTVYFAYMDLLLEQTEFLREDKFKYNQIWAGFNPDGKSITVYDPFPSSDLPVYESEELLFNSGISRDSFERHLSVVYEKYGYKEVKNLRDADFLRVSSQIYTNNVYEMSPFMSEDILELLPKAPFNPRITPELWPEVIKHRNYFEILSHRKRMLPKDGLNIKFNSGIVYKTLLLREFFKDDTVYMLYKFETCVGDISGYYNTRTGGFYSPLEDDREEGGVVADRLKATVLWFYSAFVGKHPDIELTAESFLKHFKANSQTRFTAYYERRAEISASSKNAHKDLTNYRSKASSIAGFIRRLPEGKKASQQAVEYAKSLGFELSPNETFVRPFVRQTWFLEK